ncbi:uncharacterized protein B0I36DRAFT_382491 [Microdochium trichocladiopsis]|uniref:Uncharacterized protein n=1 Tax=Microdochium trichocladiopsis TaxID=1682393 RepID=A0A9P9BTV5_9PEZI|nr:uncharacterized protein B0I36DRAFT_382491 [Microdochium trichocladiopsis]KAH7035867.1 hypothetical protein B0I36DRAFT_382491 [Microdochium trichocladiopsis]
MASSVDKNTPTFQREPDGTPVTQILYLDVDPARNLEDESTRDGKLWAEMLDLLQDSPGFKRLYWGRRLEEPEKVQIHVVRDTIDAHQTFLSSPSFQQDLINKIRRLTVLPSPSSTSSSPHPKDNDHQHHHRPPTSQLPLSIRHVYLHPFTQPSPLGSRPTLGLPVGTAIYTGATETWYAGAWPLWTHIVRHVDGCVGIAGGRVAERVAGLGDGFMVFVAWESVAKHDAYHGTGHFAKYGVVLGHGHKGYVEYGHVVFRGAREGVRGKL